MAQNDKQSLTALVWEHCPTKYKGSALVLLVKIAGLSSREGHAFPSVDHLAQMCGVTPRMIRYLLRILKKDGFLKIQSRRGHSNRFFLQAEEIRKLPRWADSMPVTPREPVTKAEPLKDAGWLAVNLRLAILEKIPEAVIPENWQTTWTAEIQKLFDQGHDVKTMSAVARFALGHEGWRDTLLGPRGAHGFVEKFPNLLKHCEAFQKENAA
jgi:hypothetical protein